MYYQHCSSNSVKHLSPTYTVHIMPKRKKPDPPDSNPEPLPDEPPEVVGYPKFVYILRLVHARDEHMFDQVYSSVKNAEIKIKLIFAEGFSHDIEIVRTNSVVVSISITLKENMLLIVPK